MKKLAEYFIESEQGHIRPQVGDSVDIVVNEELAIEADVLESTEDTLVLEYDERGISLLEGLDLIEEDAGEDFTDKEIKMAFGILNDPRFKGGNVTEITRRIEGIAKGLSDHPSVKKAILRTNEDLNEGAMKDMMHADAERMSREDFVEKHGEEHGEFWDNIMGDLDEASCGMKKRYEDTDLEVEEDVAYHTALDSLMHNTFGEAQYANAEEDAFKELKDYAETSGGIDKEEFEKAAYLVKAMGKPHLKDKAEGMLDDLIGKMDSDPRDKVIQVLSHHIDLTFLKNLLDSVEVDLDEAEYQGRKVKLGKPMRGDVGKYKVYVKDKKTGNVKKVNFGDKNMEIKRDDPKRRKSFRARHGCGTPKASDRTKARYWSCRMWSSKPVSKIV
jgi:hypothetical protein